ncbi:MAG: undecaprenyl pyrophosphate phosphatase [candidate division BRC1 bacterium ADurb.BinA364]|nr:MAG: undecaprenyl pyrophosphate phosphatase [candidate division BRC1 bacterium ADurb.BinA364]
MISIPAILGASALELRHFPEAAGANWSAAAAILAASFVSGWAALLALRAVVSRGRLSWFALYCFPAGALAVLLL